MNGQIVGRPTDYRPAFPQIARKLAQLGASQVEIAAFLEVDPATIWRWANIYPAFCKALKIGGDHATNRVERSLYEGAIAGDATKQIWYLKNKRPEVWRDRHDEARSTVVVNIAQAVVNVQSGVPTGVLNAGVLEGEAVEVAAEPALIAKPK